MLYTGHRFVNYRCQAKRGSDKDMSSILILKIKRAQKAAHGNYFTGSIHHLERYFAMFPNFMGFFSSLPKEFSWIFFHWWYTMRSNPSTVRVLWLQLCGMLQTRHPCEGAISQWLQWGSERGTGFSARFCQGHCWRLWQTVGRHILIDERRRSTLNQVQQVLVSFRFNDFCLRPHVLTFTYQQLQRTTWIHQGKGSKVCTKGATSWGALHLPIWSVLVLCLSDEGSGSTKSKTF